MRVAPALACVLLVGCGVVQDLPSDAAVAEELDAGVVVAEDAGTPEQDAGSPTPDAGPSVLVYPFAQKHSPLTAEVVDTLRAIAARSSTKRDDVFSKIGDSNTVNASYLACFAGAQVDLAGRTSLDPALAHFKAGRVDTTSPFERVSLSATVGWSAGSSLAGNPSPLQQELDAAQPRFATVMFGTNDVGAMDPFTYGRNLFTIVDTLAAQGVVPIVSSIPPRDDNMTADAWVARYNLVARGVAQARRVPFVDLHRELLTTPTHGLGPDGVHLNVFLSGGARGCALTSAGLGFGHNVRNLATLEALSRAWGAVGAGLAPDSSAPRRTGTGLPGDELVVTSLPFVDARDTRTDGVARIASYPGCASPGYPTSSPQGALANESGREVLYRLELAQPTALRAFVVTPGTADVDLHLLSAASGAACLNRHDRVITRQLAAGTYWLSVDTFQGSTGAPLAGEYLLVVTSDP